MWVISDACHGVVEEGGDESPIVGVPIDFDDDDDDKIRVPDGTIDSSAAAARVDFKGVMAAEEDGVMMG